MLKISNLSPSHSNYESFKEMPNSSKNQFKKVKTQKFEYK